MKRNVPARALAAALFAAALPAQAQQCDVFTDVLAADPFCNAVQWLKNRGITTGCTATQYCPANNVTRAQMALFLNRMGLALGPFHFGATANGTAPAPLAPGQFVPLCITTILPAATYQRLAQLRGYVNVPASGSTSMQMFLIFDANPPGPWSNANSVALTVPAPSGQQSLAWASNVVQLDAGSSFRFGIGIANPLGATGNLTLGASGCVLDVSIVNGNPITPPLDP